MRDRVHRVSAPSGEARFVECTQAQLLLRRTARIAAALLVSSCATAQSVDLGWSALNSGSELTLAGGTLRLSGSIGDGEIEVLTGGSFRMVAGFWNPTSAIPCDGDLNGDRSVSLQDLTILLANFGVASGASPDQGDLNGDGAISLADLTLFLTTFGTVCPS